MAKSTPHQIQTPNWLGRSAHQREAACGPLPSENHTNVFWDGPNVKNGCRKECRWAGDLETGAEHDNVSSRTATVQSLRGNADVAQLVAHHLAKVRVASSSLVIRSKAFLMLEGILSK